MRLIGQVKNESDAKAFGDYLTSVMIKNLVEPETDGSWAVWIQSEEQLAAGQQELANFLANPTDAKYQNAGKTAAVIEEKERREQEEYAKRVQTGRTIWPQYSMGWGTLLLIAISVAVAVVAGLPPVKPIAAGLWMSRYVQGLEEIRGGQLWRLVTPIFLHMSFTHIVFNMLSLKFLGGIVESRLGTWKFLLMTMAIAVPSNLAQGVFFGAAFGGMSGVLYGLFGFIWIRGKCDPSSGLHLDQANTVMMVAWFFLCLFKIIPNVANTVHGVGFVVGAAMGAWPLVARMFQGK